MASPVTPAVAQGLIPDPTSSKCSAFTKVLLQLPVRFYEFINWMLDSSGNLSDAFKKLISESTVKTGDLIFSAAPSDETGRLLCNAQAVNRTTYADLFAKIGTTYGVGDGTTTFNLPDYRDKFPRGVNAGAVGATGGADTATLALENMPPHNHEVKVRVGGAAGSAQIYAEYEAGTADSEDDSVDTTDAGGSGSPVVAQPFSIIPGYVSCYIYVKT